MKGSKRLTDKVVNQWFRDEARCEALHDGKDCMVNDEGESGGPDWYNIGNCDWQDRKALMLIVSAARNLCGVNPNSARDLLKLALEQIDPKRKDFGL
jgi:hypothetical protein